MLTLTYSYKFTETTMFDGMTSINHSSIFSLHFVSFTLHNILAGAPLRKKRVVFAQHGLPIVRMEEVAWLEQGSSHEYH